MSDELEAPPIDVKAMRRQEQRERRHRAILDAAFARIEADGLDQLTMPGLAKSLGIAVGGLYRTFPSKERLVVELQGRAIDRLWRRLGHRWRQVVRPPADPAVRALAGLVTALSFGLEFPTADPVHHDLLLRLWGQPLSEVDAAWLAARATPLLEDAEDRLREAIDAEAITRVDARRTLAWWWGSVQAAVALPEPLRPEPRAVVESLLQGAGASGFMLDKAWRLLERAAIGGSGGGAVTGVDEP